MSKPGAASERMSKRMSSCMGMHWLDQVATIGERGLVVVREKPFLERLKTRNEKKSLVQLSEQR